MQYHYNGSDVKHVDGIRKRYEKDGCYVVKKHHPEILSFHVKKLRYGAGCVEGQFGLEVDVVVAVQLLLLRVALPTRAGRREALGRRLVQRHVSKHEQKRVQKEPPYCFLKFH